MKIGILTFERFHSRPRGSIGSSTIRGQWLVDKWKDARLWYTGQKNDVMIFQKVYWEELMTDFKGIKILDLCDPDWLDGNMKLVKISKMVDAITCSTDELKKYLGTMIKHIPIITIPDRLNLDYFPKQKEHIDEAQAVSWFGYYHNAKEVLPQVLMTLKSHKLSLVVVSNSPYEPISTYGVEIRNTNWTPDSAYLDIQIGDFAINPPSMTRGFRFKSNNKTLIAWALGLPVANTAEEMDKFMLPENRKKEIDKRIKEIKEKWTIEKSIKQYEELICHIQNTKKTK